MKRPTLYRRFTPIRTATAPSTPPRPTSTPTERSTRSWATRTVTAAWTPAFETTSDIEEEFSLEADAGLLTDEEISTNSVEFNLGSEGFSDLGAAGGAVDAAYAVADDSYTASPDLSATTTDLVDANAAAQEGHADAAGEAQAAADEFVAQGDYSAAAEARAQAEESAEAAGDPSIIESSDYTGYGNADSSDLENAAYKQEIAEEYRA